MRANWAFTARASAKNLNGQTVFVYLGYVRGMSDDGQPAWTTEKYNYYCGTEGMVMELVPHLTKYGPDFKDVDLDTLEIMAKREVIVVETSMHKVDNEVRYRASKGL